MNFAECQKNRIIFCIIDENCLGAASEITYLIDEEIQLGVKEALAESYASLISKKMMSIGIDCGDEFTINACDSTHSENVTARTAYNFTLSCVT